MNLSPETILCKVYGKLLTDKVISILFGLKEGYGFYLRMAKAKAVPVLNNVPEETWESLTDDEKTAFRHITETALYNKAFDAMVVTRLTIEDGKIVAKCRVSLVCTDTAQVFGDSRDASLFTTTRITTGEADLLTRINDGFIEEGLVLTVPLSNVSELAKYSIIDNGAGARTVFTGGSSYNNKINNMMAFLEPLVEAIKKDPEVNSSLFVKCIDTSKTGLEEGVEYAIKSIKEDLGGLVGIDVKGETKYFKTDRFKLVE